MLRRVALVVGFLTMGVGALLDRRGLGSWDLGRRLRLHPLAAVAVAVLAGLLALAASERVRIVGSVLGTLGLVAVVAVVARAIGTGLPGSSIAVLGVRAAVAALLGVIGGCADGRPRRAGPAAVVIATTAGQLAAAGMCVVVEHLVVNWPVRAWSAASADDAGGPPGRTATPRPTSLAWTWTAVGCVRDVKAGGLGVLVADDTGSPRGTAGRERRDGGSTATASPSGDFTCPPPAARSACGTARPVTGTTRPGC